MDCGDYFTHRVHYWLALQFFLLSMCSTAAVSCGFAAGFIYKARTESHKPHQHWVHGDPVSLRERTPREGRSPTQGYQWHVASAVGEWVSAFAFVAYLLTFSRDLEKLKCEVHAQAYCGCCRDDTS